MSNGYKRAFHRVSTALDQTTERWDKSPDIKPDLIAEYEALQAWVWIPSCYSLIEQAFKLLWVIRKGITVEELVEELKKVLGKNRWARAHDLTVLFEMLTQEDQKRIENAYRAYQELHDYIPIRTVKEFLAETGKGYGRWRYLLLDGTKGLPKTHIGAMLEIATASVTILENKLFGHNNLRTVDTRIKWALNQAIVREANACAEHQREQNPDGEDFQEIFDRCRKYIEDLVKQRSDLAYGILLGDVSSNTHDAPVKFEGSAIVGRICHALAKTDKKNSRQFFLKKSRNRQGQQYARDPETREPRRPKREANEDDSVWETLD